MMRGLRTGQRQIAASGETSLETGYVTATLTRSMWALATGAILLALAEALRVSSSWPLVHDAPLIHYVVFLMAHGMAPYRDIIEINLPGTYVLDWLEMHILGVGALGLWLWDTLAGLAGLLASAWIVGKDRRLVGIVGGALAYLIHERDGAKNLGQRDWIIGSLLLVALGCLFEAKRRRQPAWMAGFMGLCALTASIKPPMIAIGLFFLAAICWLEWREKTLNWAKRSVEMVAWSLAGGPCAGRYGGDLSGTLGCHPRVLGHGIGTGSVVREPGTGTAPLHDRSCKTLAAVACQRGYSVRDEQVVATMGIGFSCACSTAL